MPDDVAEDFISACLELGDMSSALAAMAEMCNGDGAVLIYSRGRVPIRVESSPDLGTRLTEYREGNRPADPRGLRVNPTLDESFRFDLDDFSQRELAREPFYQEFLRPRGLGWHACALLSETEVGDTIHLSIKRGVDRGPFTLEDTAPLAARLSVLRAAVRFSQMAVGMLASEAADLDTGPGRSVLGFGFQGEAFDIRRTARDGSVILLRNGAVFSNDPREQGSLNAAIERMFRRASPTAAVILTASDGERWCFRLQRRPSMAGTHLAFVALVSPLDEVEEPTADWLKVARDLFHLSPAEARIAALVVRGLSVSAMAQRLSLSPGTVRNQLKAVFSKVGVTRQTELAVLLSRI